MSVENILRTIPLFQHLSDKLIQDLTERGNTVLMEAHQVVCREGDASDEMYVILEGNIKVFKSDAEAHDVQIDALTSGDVFGEMALLDKKPRSATVQCETPCKLFKLGRQSLIALMLETQSQELFDQMFSVLSNRLRALMEKYFSTELSQRVLQAEMEAQRHRALAQMVAGVAHEINTPLGIVNTAVNMIDNRVKRDEIASLFSAKSASQEVLEEIQEAARLAQSHTTRAHKLVQNFKKISVSQLTDTKETIDISALLNDIIDLFSINARKAKLQIEFNDALIDGTRVWVGYPGHLTQVLMNLFTNIQRYAYQEGSGGKIEITISSNKKKKPPCFTIRVRDFGKGIAPEHLSKVFDPFFTTGRGKGGTGLGLAIVRNLVTESLQGTIEAASESGQGTTFTVTIPQIIP